MRHEVSAEAARDHSGEEVHEQRTYYDSNDPAHLLIERFVSSVRQPARDPELVDETNEDDRDDRADFCEQTVTECG